MTQVNSKVIFQDNLYVVCVTKAGLSIQNKRTNKGKLIPANSPAFGEWLYAFENSLDDTESRDLCRAFQ